MHDRLLLVWLDHIWCQTIREVYNIEMFRGAIEHLLVCIARVLMEIEIWYPCWRDKAGLTVAESLFSEAAAAC